MYCTFLGRNSYDIATSIALDHAGNTYITGQAGSNFPVTSGAYQTRAGNQNTVFVTKLNARGSSLLYSTFLGGNSIESGAGIAVDGSGNAFVTGHTSSANFPVTSDAYQAAWHGVEDAFLTKLNATGSGLLYSSYLGGGSDDGGTGIAVDGSGNAYVTGYTSSTNFPSIKGAYQTNLAGLTNAFVAKFNGTNNSLIYLTLLGGNSYDSGRSIAVDRSGNANVTGQTNSTKFPVTSGAYQFSLGGGADVFFAKLNVTGSALLYSTYFGGGSDDFGTGIALDDQGSAYIAGYTFSTNFPVTSGAYQKRFGGLSDAFAVRLAFPFSSGSSER